MLVRDIIKAAYANLGVTDLEEGPSSAQYDQGLQALNSMLASWSRGRQTLYGLFDETLTLTPGKASYTVGVGGEFNTAWAFEVRSAFIRDSNDDTPLELMTQEEWNAVPDKTLTGTPYALFYDPAGYPTGVLRLYPIADAAYVLGWSAQKVLGGYANINVTLGIAPEYEEALEWNLTVRLGPKCRVPISAEIAALARKSKGTIPMPIEMAQFDGFTASSRYNIFTDS